MKHSLVLLAGVVALILALFAAAQVAGVPVLEDPTPWLRRGGAAAALATTGLLVVDVLLPVPSSLVMIANGALFGVVGGALLTLVGGTGAGLAGYAAGRWGSRRAERFIPPEERARAAALIERWGALAVVVSRPVPVLAESVAIAAGLAGMRLSAFAASVALGMAPLAVVYALTGASAARTTSGFLVFGLVVGVAGLVWLTGTRARRADAPAAGAS